VQPAVQHRVFLPNAELLVIPEGPPLQPIATPGARDGPVVDGGGSRDPGGVGLMRLPDMVCPDLDLPRDSVGDLVEGLVREADRGGLAASDLSAAFWVMATSRGEEGLHRTLPVLADRLIGRASDLDAGGVARTFWATAVLHEESPVLRTMLPALAERLVRTAGGMGVHEAALSLCSLASLRAAFKYTSLAVLPMTDLLVDRFLGEAGEVEPWLLANLFWTLVMIPLDGDRLSAMLRLLVDQAKPAVADFNAQAVSLVLWSVAMLQRRAAEEGTDAAYGTSELLPALAGRFGDLAEGMSPVEMAGAVWALGALRAGVPHPQELLTKVRVPLACSFDAMDLSELSLALWGMGVIGQRDEELLELAAARAIELDRTTRMRARAAALPRISWACAALDFKHAMLMQTVARRFASASDTLRYLKPESFHALLWVYRQQDFEQAFFDFTMALEAKLLYWLRTRRNYVTIDPRTSRFEKYYVMLDAVAELGSYGPDARQVREK